ncbi:MAG TPA: pitrilysin family protein, partial [Longimicrobiales bacterium]|nr:pitrilysin family protein [Longimicrobiales bacterium]
FHSLARNVEDGLALFAEMVMRPRFDAARVEVWRGQELEAVRRRQDNPGFFAATEFNRLMYGEHPVGWVIVEEDLDPEDLSEASLRRVHEAIYCPEHVAFGVTGALPLEEATRLLESAFAGWAACPDTLAEPPGPDVRDAGGVFLIARALAQSTVYMGHGSALRQGPTPEYFASRIANAILGASGFTSRLVREVRTERGLAYGAGSFWTTPEENEGIFGATTSTRAPATVEAVRVMTDVIAGMTEAPPSPEEVRLAIEDISNGFVFNFESPARIVARRMLYHQEGLPADWLERYLEGVQAVTPAQVHRVMSEHVHPERLTVLILGDPAAMDPPPSVLGEVVELRVKERQ